MKGQASDEEFFDQAKASEEGWEGAYSGTWLSRLTKRTPVLRNLICYPKILERRWLEQKRRVRIFRAPKRTPSLVGENGWKKGPKKDKKRCWQRGRDLLICKSRREKDGPILENWTVERKTQTCKMRVLSSKDDEIVTGQDEAWTDGARPSYANA